MKGKQLANDSGKQGRLPASKKKIKKQRSPRQPW
jgi:hypothetical protein